MESHRKPYIREVKRSWWLSNRVYTRYMIREGTAVLSLLVSLELLAICLITVIFPDNAQTIIVTMIQHPAIIIFNIIALLAVMFHTVTWFSLMPKAVRVFRSSSPKETRLLPAHFFLISLWLVTIVASAIIALALIFAV